MAIGPVQLLVVGFSYPSSRARSARSWTGFGTTTWFM
jgi:hypothetical protein